MNKKLIVLQDGNKECGSAALLSIIRFYGGNISVSKLVEMTNTTKDGTNFLEIKNVALKLGLKAEGYKVDSFNSLEQIVCPYIVQLVDNSYTHFVVVYKIKKNKLLIMDPAKGKITMSQEEFINKWTSYIMTFSPYKKLLVFKDENYLTKKIFQILIKNKKLILNVFFLSVIFTIISCLVTYYFQIVIDFILNTNYSNLMIITLAFLILMLYKSFANYFRNELLIYLNQKLDLTLILSTFNKILLLPYNYYKNKTTGEMLARINDIAHIKTAISKIIITVFLDLLVCLVGGIILYNINNKLFLFLIIITFVYLLVILIFNKIIKKMININQENNAKVNSFLVETINGFETVKGLNLESTMSNKFEKIYVDSLNDNLVYEKISNIEIFVKEIISNISNILIIFLGVKLILENKFELSSLITFNFLSSYYTEPIKNIIDFNKEYYYMKNSLKRANNLFEVDTISNKTTNLTVSGDIQIKNLNFKYVNKLILNNVSFSIKDKEKVLLLGKSGTGKSTLLKLLFKYYQVKRNNISINNIDINDYSVFDIRNNITYISQNEIIFNDTIKNNILLDRNISEEEFLKVVKLTYTDEIVKDDLLGYDKILEENAVNLSGGQRQRIILARALLKNSKIILIDEGLNEIDINLERKILKNIFKFYNDKTIIIISHRLNNMDLFDKVIKLENKKVNVIYKNKGDTDE